MAHIAPPQRQVLSMYFEAASGMQHFQPRTEATVGRKGETLSRSTEVL